ncbi:hypothetical protein K503DRAFT_716593 [Rhizopogon vinicolor AM-OR11-026]|uniref:Srp40 C-terminal domain-containing protein n=1 Tax=Rhizopogon vinicolor AM-OR11-026 TaxID=1314800 RepID=A0A1B7N3G8_9AGAM|nr:hypothetical protein K503DRAFT_716593 [Rhizopogon vinicolor AM-OR11-026]
MEVNIAVTYSLIYAFLKKQDQTKAADAVKKAARNIIVLRDDFEFGGPHLDEIVKQWIDSQAAGSSSESSSDDSSDDSSSSSSSDSSSSSSESTSSSDESESSSSESDSDSEGETQANKKVPVIQSCAERDTSVTLSSDAKVPEVKSGIPPKKSSIEESSGSDSDDSDSDDSDSDSSSDKKPVAKAVQNKDGGSSDSESSSSGSESSSSDSESTSSSSESESEAEIKKSTKDSIVSSKSRNVDVSSIPKEETRVTKKRKTSESGAAVVTAVAVIPPGDNVQVSIKNKDIQRNGNSKPHRNANERFSRIKPQAIPQEQLLDNGYEAKGGVVDDYGARAHRDLIVTRGAGFRKEKNKKKRGSYRGGEITLQTHSIKFTD